jgi:hypothetical protein
MMDSPPVTVQEVRLVFSVYSVGLGSHGECKSQAPMDRPTMRRG